MRKEITEEEYKELMRRKENPQCVEDAFPCNSLGIVFENNKPVKWYKT